MLLLSITFFFLMLRTSSSLDTIDVYQNISDGENIVSGNEKFEMGFFSPGNSKNRYLGIWFKITSPRTIVWVANRETPLNDTLGMVKLDSQGTLSLVNGGGTVIWSSNSSVSGTNGNPIAQLLGSGNLVIKDENSINKENIIWQSFDYPGDTYIPGMKLGKNLITGREMYLTSWKSADDPSPGEYALRYLMVKGKYEQVYIRKNYVIETRIEPYKSIAFAGQPNYKPDPVHMYTLDMVVNQNEMYYVYITTTFSITIIMALGGKLEVLQLNMPSQEWLQDLTLPLDFCDNYGLCGSYGSCSTSNCTCLK